MPNDDIHAQWLRYLGHRTKGHRQGAEQFCAFAFDLHKTGSLEPPMSHRPREKTMRIGGRDLSAHQHIVTNWMAAYWQMCQPIHTEKTVLSKFDSWYSRYQSAYGEEPEVLYIYSFLIPCQRDGTNGRCADAIAGMVEGYSHLGKRMKVCIGWSNNDTDAEMSIATRHALADLQEDGYDVLFYPGLSIAG